MAKGTKKTAKSKKPSSKSVPKIIQKLVSLFGKLKLRTAALYTEIIRRRDIFLARRPHRSFRRTRRRDYVRSLKLPSYVALTTLTFQTLRKHWRTFALLALLYTIVIIVIGAVTSQNSFADIRELLNGTTQESSGGVFGFGEAVLLALSTFASLPTTITVEQQIYLGIGGLFVWLCTVWLLREYMLGRKPKLRDGLYSSGSPFIATVVVTFFIAVQLIPVGLMAIAYASLLSTGVIDSGFGSMIFWVAAAAAATLVLYWMTNTLFALVIVTLPGMYPLRAVRAAGDIVLGRRLRILYRLLWGALVIVLAWVAIAVPIAIGTSMLSSVWTWVENVPITPYVGAVLTSVSMVWFAAYVYLFYRKVVDND